VNFSAATQLTVGGTARQHRFDQNTATNWQLSIQAVNKINAGPTSEAIGIQAGAVGAPAGWPGIYCLLLNYCTFINCPHLLFHYSIR
jgi:hypothetical protein